MANLPTCVEGSEATAALENDGLDVGVPSPDDFWAHISKPVPETPPVQKVQSVRSQGEVEDLNLALDSPIEADDKQTDGKWDLFLCCYSCSSTNLVEFHNSRLLSAFDAVETKQPSILLTR